ncbi:MAG: flavodoxin [Synergistaceae bacterium]|nr:flavodoxin [Synergistaceae bacterium]
MAKIITVFFSMKGETYVSGRIVDLAKGYTNVAAEFVQRAVGGDLFEIEPVRIYTKDHFKMIEEAKEELSSGIRPPIKAFLENFSEYDTFFLGYPNWWNALPMPVVTFLEHYKWHGKRVVPFCTSDSKSLGHSIEEIREICAGAAVEKGYSIHGPDVERIEEQIIAWAKEQI